jgi:anti-sigma regulatory factor (Ser/Thr protein kinase)
MCKSVQERETRCKLPITLNSLRKVWEFVMTQALHAGLSEQDAGLFTVASVEIFTNIVRHAKGLLAGAPAELIVHCAQSEFVLEVIHLGVVFEPPEAEVKTDFAAFAEGGLGLTIIRKACDRVDYLHHAGVSTVRLCHYIES